MKTLRRTMVVMALLGGISAASSGFSQDAIPEPPRLTVFKVRIKAWCVDANGNVVGTPVYMNGCSDADQQGALEQAVNLAYAILNCEYPMVSEIKSTSPNLYCPEPPGEQPLSVNFQGRAADENCWRVVLRCYVRCGESFLVPAFGRTPKEARCLAQNEMFQIVKDEGLQFCRCCCVEQVNLCCQPMK